MRMESASPTRMGDESVYIYLETAIGGVHAANATLRRDVLAFLQLDAQLALDVGIDVFTASNETVIIRVTFSGTRRSVGNVAFRTANGVAQRYQRREGEWKMVGEFVVAMVARISGDWSAWFNTDDAGVLVTY